MPSETRRMSRQASCRGRHTHTHTHTDIDRRTLIPQSHGPSKDAGMETASHSHHAVNVNQGGEYQLITHMNAWIHAPTKPQPTANRCRCIRGPPGSVHPSVSHPRDASCPCRCGSSRGHHPCLSFCPACRRVCHATATSLCPCGCPCGCRICCGRPCPSNGQNGAHSCRADPFRHHFSRDRAAPSRSCDPFRGRGLHSRSLRHDMSGLHHDMSHLRRHDRTSRHRVAVCLPWCPVACLPPSSTI
mmetsp:Transcript_21747/g.61861  ORF Transcript_21747/g.61861 Transcript_21747/m.61861 type:complete len:244 (-) Transcript_21747:13-744(-)